jgi:myo-inositol-1(or 4)-monophosphatase
MNKSDIQKLIPFITKEGKELVAKQGTIKDIGIKKQYLTQEDIEMERGIKKIIDSFEGENYFYSEEENDNFISGQSVWICDPISGTKLFLEGKSHYAVVLAHLNNGVTDFAIVYDPSSDALFKSDGIYATMNGHKIKPSDRSKNKVIFAPSYGWMDLEKRDKLEGLLKNDY